MPDTLNVPFKCRCMDAEGSVDVRYRQEGEDVADWMAVLQLAIGEDHRRRSPWCRSTTMEYAKIPAPDNAPFIGGRPKLDS